MMAKASHQKSSKCCRCWITMYEMQVTASELQFPFAHTFTSRSDHIVCYDRAFRISLSLCVCLPPTQTYNTNCGHERGAARPPSCHQPGGKTSQWPAARRESTVPPISAHALVSAGISDVPTSL